MEEITVYPENEEQKSLLKSLFKEMNVYFEMTNADDDVEMTKKQFFTKINKSIQQAEEKKTKKLSKDKQKEFLGL